MSVAASQQRHVLELFAQLRPHLRSDRNLPARLQTLLARRRAFGSRDRRLYRELLYTALRYLPWIEPVLDADPAEAVRRVAWLATASPATEAFRAALCADWPPCPPSVSARAALLLERLASDHSALGNLHSAFPPPLPPWFRDHCPEAFAPAQLDALLSRAPLWLRLQTDDPARVTAEFSSRGWRWEISSVLPTALRLLDEVDVTATAAYRDGLVEVQDLGSQLVLASAGLARATSPTRWLDACAGAGGKTLQLAALLGPAARIDAYDIRPAALRELAARAARAHQRHIAILSHAPTDSYDGVLVDAPCSGSGTWRRAPHLKWSTAPEHIAGAAARQTALLGAFAARVRPGGRLIYATCSLSLRENDDIAAAFLATHPAFAAEPPAHAFGALVRPTGLTLLPALHDTDGFFVATFRRHASPAN